MCDSKPEDTAQPTHQFHDAGPLFTDPEKCFSGVLMNCNACPNSAGAGSSVGKMRRHASAPSDGVNYVAQYRVMGLGALEIRPTFFAPNFGFCPLPCLLAAKWFTPPNWVSSMDFKGMHQD